LGVLSRIRHVFRRDNLGVTDEKAWNPGLWRIFPDADIAGEHVDEYSALNYSAVYNAISLISGTLSSLPLHLMQRSGQSTTPAHKHPLFRVMHDRANPYMTAMALRECLVAHILAWGNGYAEIVRDGMGRVVELWPIAPNRIRPEMLDGKLIYIIKVDNQEIPFSRENILHIPGPGFDGFVGYSVVRLAAKSISLGKAMETFGAHYFGQGTHPGIIVKHPGKLSETASKNMRDALAATYSGLGQTHKLMMLEEGMTAEKVSIPPNDSQFLESRQFQIPEIARWFNLPPHKLKDLTKSSFSNIESEQISFVTDSLLPWGVRIEQNLNMQLLNNADIAKGLYFKHVFEGLLRGNSKDRAEFYKAMFNIGAMSINEIRGKEDLNPVDGGDIHLVPLNMTTLDKAGQVEEPPAEEEAAPEIIEDQGARNVVPIKMGEIR